MCPSTSRSIGSPSASRSRSTSLGPLAVATIASRRVAGPHGGWRLQASQFHVPAVPRLLTFNPFFYDNGHAAGFCWALYIMLSVPVARLFPGASEPASATARCASDHPLGHCERWFRLARSAATWSSRRRRPALLGATVVIGAGSTTQAADQRLRSRPRGRASDSRADGFALPPRAPERARLGRNRVWLCTASAGAALEITGTRTEPPDA